MKNSLLIFLLLIFQTGFSQKTETFKIKKYSVAVLDDSLKESSGLNFFNGKLYTFNDSGNTSELFQIDPKTGKIQKKLQTKLQNIDWESLTNDGENFYIGDFGNNLGTRKDLKIYKVPFRDSLKLDSTKIISFYYPEQNDFTPKNLNNNFDDEAMIYLNGKIHVFTKEWLSKSTSHYTIDPANFENQAAKKIENYKTDFVVTDASYFNKKLYSVGYTKLGKIYLEVFSKSENDTFFTEIPKKYYLGSAFSLGQIEGISVNQNGIYLSGEYFHSPLGTKKGQLFFIPFSDFN
ncbi:hypothetical protein [Halpernia frigidisoli]|uniref:Uncharacterized protein n=1 Tax=Halpernia frigidisoli TaxID=1125876 RepID=A0A1I3DYD9_9FLAO|nr:hypothetical protein [Halpernia frigidisoli]SFH91663.1 hypothetical protein SAMN05443292_0768 [Halpernia frigidisoli]